MSAARGIALGLLVALLAACGGGGGSGGNIVVGSSGDSSSGGNGSGNVQPISVSLGPNGNYINGIFTQVTVCIHGTSNCQTINNILVDSGSYGLRILGSVLNLGLPAQTTTSGATVGECTPYADGFTWGPVATADIQIAGETASSVPVAVFGQSGNFPGFPTTPPTACQQNGTEEDSLGSFGANGVLGVGPFQYDCGTSCANNAARGYYYACGTTTISCIGVAQAENNQVQNPVALFGTDGNGVIIQLPSISSSGQSGVTGSLIFGIGTQSNNGLGSAQVLTVDGSDDFSTNFNGSNGIPAFIDSGSNALYFDDSSIAQCGSPDTGFYCPPSTLSLNAQMVGVNNVSVTVPFSVANTINLLNNSNGAAAFNNLAGSATTASSGGSHPQTFFDWGLPFFFGHSVYFAIGGKSAPGGTAPYYAF